MNETRAFERIDESADALFYHDPRFVEHIDPLARAAVTRLYREIFPPDGALLDLMSSWISHLPPEIGYSDVVGVGMNAAELAANPRLKRSFVHDLNAQPALPLAARTFDGAAMCVSIQYLTRPIEVLADLARVLRHAAPIVITFSNRCFPTKAVAVWRALDARGQLALIAHYLQTAGGWTDITARDCSVAGGDPLYAVVARAAHANSLPQPVPR